MKKLILIAATLMIAVGAYAQGTVNFRNRATTANPPINAPVTLNGANVSGPNYVAQLYVGTSADNLAAVGSPVAFQSGAGVGYFLGGTLTLPTFAPGAAVVAQVRAWDTSGGATWDTSLTRGSSANLNLTLGGAGSPPGLPTELVGLTGFSMVTVPEPSTMALALLGGLALLFRRRK